MVLKKQILAIQDIYVTVKRRQTLDPQKVEALAESMMEKGQEAPIIVRPDGKRFVLVEGLHRLEAKALGATTVPPTCFRLASIDLRLVRSWGRIGTRDQEKVEEYPDELQAGAVPEAIARVKRRRGSGFVRGSSFDPYQRSGASRIIMDDSGAPMSASDTPPVPQTLRVARPISGPRPRRLA
jgi:predicted DNA-binding WGR domain protein